METNIVGESTETLWKNLYNAQQWEEATTLFAVLATLLVSFVFTIRMLQYKNKSFLDWTIVLREIAWFLVAFRFTTAIGFEWSGWADWSWLVWGYVAFTTILAFAASQREHYNARRYNQTVHKISGHRRKLLRHRKG